MAIPAGVAAPAGVGVRPTRSTVFSGVFLGSTFRILLCRVLLNFAVLSGSICDSMDYVRSKCFPLLKVDGEVQK